MAREYLYGCVADAIRIVVAQASGVDAAAKRTKRENREGRVASDGKTTCQWLLENGVVERSGEGGSKKKRREGVVGVTKR